MNVGIKGIGVYRPSERVNNLERGAELSVEGHFVEEKIGILSLARRGNGEETSDLALKAVQRLVDGFSLNLADLECLVFVTQNPDVRGLPHTSALLHRKLQLSGGCSVFDMSLGCSGFVHGLVVAKALMESQSFQNGLLVTSDPYSKIVDSQDRDTALLFGDGATATWLGDNAEWVIGPADFGTRSNQCDALAVSSEGTLTMNGRAVFNFAAVEVPKSIDRVLQKAQLDMGQIDMVLLHQGSRYIVETLAKRLKVEDKTPFAVTDYGNTVSSSIPMLLAENVPRTVRRLLLCGFGVGLAWATCTLERNDDHA